MGVGILRGMSCSYLAEGWQRQLLERTSGLSSGQPSVLIILVDKNRSDLVKETVNGVKWRSTHLPATSYKAAGTNPTVHYKYLVNSTTLRPTSLLHQDAAIICNCNFDQGLTGLRRAFLVPRANSCNPEIAITLTTGQQSHHEIPVSVSLGNFVSRSK